MLKTSRRCGGGTRNFLVLGASITCLLDHANYAQRHHSFKSVVEKYNPLPRQSTTLKKRGRGRRLEDAQLNSTMSDLRVS